MGTLCIVEKMPLVTDPIGYNTYSSQFGILTQKKTIVTCDLFCKAMPGQNGDSTQFCVGTATVSLERHDELILGQWWFRRNSDQ